MLRQKWNDLGFRNGSVKMKVWAPLNHSSRPRRQEEQQLRAAGAAPAAESRAASVPKAAAAAKAQAPKAAKAAQVGTSFRDGRMMAE